MREGKIDREKAREMLKFDEKQPGFL